MQSQEAEADAEARYFKRQRVPRVIDFVVLIAVIAAAPETRATWPSLPEWLIWLVIIGMTEIVSAFATRNDLKKAGKAVAGMTRGAPERAA